MFDFKTVFAPLGIDPTLPWDMRESAEYHAEVALERNLNSWVQEQLGESFNGLLQVYDAYNGHIDLRVENSNGGLSDERADAAWKVVNAMIKLNPGTIEGISVSSCGVMVNDDPEGRLLFGVNLKDAKAYFSAGTLYDADPILHLNGDSDDLWKRFQDSHTGVTQ